MLRLPDKLLPLVTDFNNYNLFLIEGGRGSGKSQSVARLLLYLGDQRCLRIFCGRETQNKIEDSVYALLKELIVEYNLAYTIYANKIEHKYTGTTFSFMGFREQGLANIKGLQGVDILWIDEAEAIAAQTLKVIMPTIRKENCRVIFTQNRYMRDDAVPEYCSGRAGCLHIKINYFENPYCPLGLRQQAEDCKAKSERDYRHIWLGEPLQAADDYLFNYDKLHEAYDIVAFGDRVPRQRVLGIDFAAQGNDDCVATVLDRLTNQHWRVSERIPWHLSDSMQSVGKIVGLVGSLQPDITIIDIGGMGKPVYDRLCEVGLKMTAFDGASNHGIDAKTYRNWRAQGYFTLKEWFDAGFLIVKKDDAEIVRQLEKIKYKYLSGGQRIIEAKADMKKEVGYSPDDADSLMMAVTGAAYHLGRPSNFLGSVDGGANTVRRINRGRTMVR